MDILYNEQYYPYRCSKCFQLGEKCSVCCGQIVNAANNSTTIFKCLSCTNAYTVSHAICACGSGSSRNGIHVKDYYATGVAKNRKQSFVAEMTQIRESLAQFNKCCELMVKNDIVEKAIHMSKDLEKYAEGQEITKQLNLFTDNLKNFCNLKSPKSNEKKELEVKELEVEVVDS